MTFDKGGGQYGLPVWLRQTEALSAAMAESTPTQIKLVHDLLDKYDKKAKPMWDNTKPINVSFTVSLYQILELNEPQQFVLLNAWIIENCTMIFSSWTYDQTGIDYFPASDEISIANYLENEGWELMTTKGISLDS
ncbi:hypothetical protein TELCIR_16238 [Teladorsagia circumcincta]|uniref:Neurotransmitter-gated ion-channel ligand-binding domain-containing protein n=1 Tax=Teladorsagia circumcincta TaxID=45464 RepID=A0A2G9TWB7_TELCI|nr:hypothetical protein TELCIR_16238 [Teladorsagia circumcincta]